MTRHQYNKNINNELRALNKRIDYKILHGLRYSEDSQRHKILLRQLSQQSRRGLLNRLMPFIFQFQ